ncbi:MAG TPA: aldo/keto reductase [Acidimicrobiales bacterium]|nr:aldo/keto reductase [Acidimicrobiales bacterium]
MQQITLGRTGLTASVAGLGAGGPSRLGLRTGADAQSPIDLVRHALDLGITFVDTAPTYGTEEIVGKAIAGRRDEIVLSTKVRPRKRLGERNSAEEVRQALEESLRNLGTDVVDLLHLHAVEVADYEFAMEELLPVLEEFRAKGSARFLAISEDFGTDLEHELLRLALVDDRFDVVMVGFNFLNPSAQRSVLPAAAKRGTGVEVMYAVRRALSRPERLHEILAGLVTDGLVDAELLGTGEPLEFLVREGGARSLVDAAYRFARHQAPGAVILTGTGSPEHLTENVASIDSPPLDPAAVRRLEALFGHLATTSGD